MVTVRVGDLTPAFRTVGRFFKSLSHCANFLNNSSSPKVSSNNFTVGDSTLPDAGAAGAVGAVVATVGCTFLSLPGTC